MTFSQGLAAPSTLNKVDFNPIVRRGGGGPKRAGSVYWKLIIKIVLIMQFDHFMGLGFEI